MRKAYLFAGILFLSIFLIIVSDISGETITKKTITIKVPPDHDSNKAFKMEFTVPENMTAFDLTVWGAEKSWGIAAVSGESGGEMDEIYKYSPSSNSYDEPVPDAESTEEIDNSLSTTGGGFDEFTSETTSLSKIVLTPGSYVIWTYEGAGKSIVIEYFLGTGK
ncbi:MAG: hypothetical protein JW984_11545 [Deltaproteobacteria bacterium]|uniref:Uncharacterized protein n=1 Tax=Candidatus Zymogenus saltonus TaxID=2844893 RepID=A0A9D8KET0_9DELT|nr:hypothetical protein [Candidatus Zymogenus saltonus]